MMCTGQDPYKGMTSAMIILAKASPVQPAAPLRARCLWLAGGRAPSHCCSLVGTLPPSFSPSSPPLQVRALDHPDSVRLPRMENCPEPLQQLVWDCTRHNRRCRPAATQVAARLQELLDALA